MGEAHLPGIVLQILFLVQDGVGFALQLVITGKSLIQGRIAYFLIVRHFFASFQILCKDLSV